MIALRPDWWDHAHFDEYLGEMAINDDAPLWAKKAYLKDKKEREEGIII